MDNPQTPPPLPEEEEHKPSTVFLVVTSLLVALNMFLKFGDGMRQTRNASYAIGSGMSSLILPVLVALLFSIGKHFRNARSRTRIVFWTSLVILLSILASMGQQMPHPR